MPELVYTVLFHFIHFLQKSPPICSIIPMHAHEFTHHSSQIFLMQRKESSAYYLHVWTNKQDFKFSQQCSGLIRDESKKKHPRRFGSTSVDCNNVLDLEYMAYFGGVLKNSVHKNKFHIANTNLVEFSFSASWTHPNRYAKQVHMTEPIQIVTRSRFTWQNPHKPRLTILLFPKSCVVARRWTRN